jgi:Trk-type K+ transport system membrane component
MIDSIYISLISIIIFIIIFVIGFTYYKPYFILKNNKQGENIIDNYKLILYTLLLSISFSFILFLILLIYFTPKLEYLNTNKNVKLNKVETDKNVTNMNFDNNDTIIQKKYVPYENNNTTQKLFKNIPLL